MDSDLTLLQSLVPDVLKIIRQRFLVLEQISLLAPVGRRVVAKKLGKATANKMRLLYGGSVKPSNAAELLALPDVDGGLIGGASLVPEKFTAIVDAAQ